MYKFFLAISLLSISVSTGALAQDSRGTPDEQKASLKGLVSAKGLIRHELGRRLSNLKFSPDIHFELDPSPETVSSRFHAANSLPAHNLFFYSLLNATKLREVSVLSVLILR